MKHVRTILLVASALALFISGCSQPEDAQTPPQQPSLEPQFGTAGEDVNHDLAVAPEGGVYVLSEQYEEFPSGEVFYSSEVTLSRYSSGGNQVWTEEVAALEEDTDSVEFPRWRASDLERDSKGNAYVLYALHRTEEDAQTRSDYRVRIFNPSGTLMHTFDVGITRSSFLYPDDPEVPPALAVDSKGNTYVAVQDTKVEDFYTIIRSNVLRKYSVTGQLLWERPSSVATPTGVAIATDGIIYVSGVGGLARHTSTGTVVWKKSGYFNDVATSGSSVYTRNKNNIFAFSSSGQPKWSRVMAGLNNPIIQDLSGDTNGNVYVSGKSFIGGDNWNAFARKFNAAGSMQWAKSYGTPAFDDATGISTLSGSDIYVTGVTLGSLAHPNRGDEDGYVRKLNASGNPVWTR